jgi:hypothetical protein
MKKKIAFIMVLLTGFAGVVATLIWILDLIPAMYYEALLVVDFPLFVLSMGLWWMARERDSDIPFVGY